MSGTAPQDESGGSPLFGNAEDSSAQEADVSGLSMDRSYALPTPRPPHANPFQQQQQQQRYGAAPPPQQQQQGFYDGAYHHPPAAMPDVVVEQLSGDAEFAQQQQQQRAAPWGGATPGSPSRAPAAGSPRGEGYGAGPDVKARAAQRYGVDSITITPLQAADIPAPPPVTPPRDIAAANDSYTYSNTQDSTAQRAGSASPRRKAVNIDELMRERKKELQRLRAHRHVTKGLASHQKRSSCSGSDREGRGGGGGAGGDGSGGETALRLRSYADIHAERAARASCISAQRQEQVQVRRAKMETSPRKRRAARTTAARAHTTGSKPRVQHRLTLGSLLSHEPEFLASDDGTEGRGAAVGYFSDESYSIGGQLGARLDHDLQHQIQRLERQLADTVTAKKVVEMELVEWKEQMAQQQAQVTEASAAAAEQRAAHLEQELARVTADGEGRVLELQVLAQQVLACTQQNAQLNQTVAALQNQLAQANEQLQTQSAAAAAAAAAASAAPPAAMTTSERTRLETRVNIATAKLEAMESKAAKLQKLTEEQAAELTKLRSRGGGGAVAAAAAGGVRSLVNLVYFLLSVGGLGAALYTGAFVYGKVTPRSVDVYRHTY